MRSMQTYHDKFNMMRLSAGISLIERPHFSTLLQYVIGHIPEHGSCSRHMPTVMLHAKWHRVSCYKRVEQRVWIPWIPLDVSTKNNNNYCMQPLSRRLFCPVWCFNLLVPIELHWVWLIDFPCQLIAMKSLQLLRDQWSIIIASSEFY